MGGNLAVASLSFPVRESFFCKKSVQKRRWGERKELLLSSRNVRSLFFSFSLSLSRSLCKYSKNGLFRMFVHGKREKIYIKTWRMTEYHVPRIFPFEKREKSSVLFFLTHFLGGLCLLPKREESSPSRCFVVLGEIGYLRHHPLPPNSLWQIFFVVPPPTDPKKGWNATSKKGEEKGKKLRKKRRELWQLLPASAIEEGGEKEKENHKWHFLATAFFF